MLKYNGFLRQAQPSSGAISKWIWSTSLNGEPVPLRRSHGSTVSIAPTRHGIISLRKQADCRAEKLPKARLGYRYDGQLTATLTVDMTTPPTMSHQGSLLAFEIPSPAVAVLGIVVCDFHSIGANELEGHLGAAD